MNENVCFILGEKSLIIKIVEENDDFKGGCISLLQQSNIINKLCNVLSSEGVIVLADQLIINKQNDVLAVTLLLDTGKCIRQKKTLTEADLVALVSIASNDQEFLIGGRYE